MSKCANQQQVQGETAEAKGTSRPRPSLLFVTSSPFGAEAKSRRVALELIAAWRKCYPNTTVFERDLYGDPLPHLSGEAFAARSRAEDELTEEQRTLVAVTRAEIALVEAADVIVIAASMYNYSISSALKVWIDHIVVAGRTFTYEDTGPRGLLKNKKVFVVSARGGVYSAGSPQAVYDFNEPYLRCILGFVGLTDLRFINIEGLALGAEAAAAGVQRARDTIGMLLSEAHQGETSKYRT